MDRVFASPPHRTNTKRQREPSSTACIFYYALTSLLCLLPLIYLPPSPNCPNQHSLPQPPLPTAQFPLWALPISTFFIWGQCAIRVEIFILLATEEFLRLEEVVVHNRIW
ncbi:hypothetical protein AAHE18_16G003500 [Arachis hypogaea]